jgi:hypothetical protein
MQLIGWTVSHEAGAGGGFGRQATGCRLKSRKKVAGGVTSRSALQDSY